jgi:putative FmdB family regulatory protein
MPIYEYECGSCHHRFELKQGFHDKPQAECPQCNKKARRVFHPAPIIFKGSGFYVTDHKTSNPASNSAPAKAEEKKPGTKKPEEKKTEVKKPETRKTSEKSG